MSANLYKHFLRSLEIQIFYVRLIRFLVFSPSSSVGVNMHDYKPLRVAVMIFNALVNTVSDSF